ncbi:hypothetical protein [Deinococcus sp. QL22]|uniref:hypothetical protein n=1 Tax=Deinococcus sp. QL22 TaxID=2939437 RepID=UPI00201702D8|nr:hypothetical protein [Deinococcus sp. QL22]UQN08745.1 hypothetical protein M1R55_21755 [Deinococcus sp. QL22]
MPTRSVSSQRLSAVILAAKARQELALIASLPVNDLAYAQAALRGGAHALKLHFGLTHRASQQVAPTLADQPGLIARLRDLAPDVPLGAVLGDQPGTVDAALDLAAECGLDFISGYAHALPARAFEAGPELLVALDDRSPPNWAGLLPPGALLEASVIQHTEYGGPLTVADLLKYADLRRRTGALLIVPTQKHIRPADLAALRAAGADALMYGVIVTGPDAAGFETAAAQYRAGERLTDRP